MKRFCYFLMFLTGWIIFSTVVSAQQVEQKSFFPDHFILNDIFDKQKGFGPVQTFDFGTVRAVSCRQTVHDQKKILTALQVSLNPEWVLKKPMMTSGTNPLWTEEKIFYPFSTDDSYQGTVFFPIIYTLTDSSQPFFVHKEIPLTVCRNETCQTQSVLFSLNLNAGTGYPTSVCPAVTDALASSPHPLPENIVVSARVAADNRIQVIVDFPQQPKMFEGYFPKAFQYTLQKKSIYGLRAEMIFVPAEKIKEGLFLPFTLVSSQGTFETNLYPRFLPFLVADRPIDYPAALSSGLLLLFFSAFYLLFWSIRFVHQKEFDAIWRKVYRYAFAFPFLIAGLLFFGVPIGLIFSHPIMLALQAILLIGLLIKPYISIRFLPILLPIMPYLFLTDYFLSVPPFQWGVFRIAFVWSLCCAAPFYFTRRIPLLFQSFSTAQQPIRLIIRLPLIINLIGIGLLFLLPDVAVPYSKAALQAALQENKAVYVTVENNACLTCRLNHLSARFTNPARFFYQKGDLVLMRASQHSPAGKDLLKNYGLSSSASFGLLFGPNDKNGYFMKNKYLQSNEWESFFEQVGLTRPAPQYSIAE